MPNFEPSPEMNFDPAYLDSDLISGYSAEFAIVRMIIDGSGGPDNEEMTEDGLRFVRYLLSTSRSARVGFLPNLKDIETIYRLAREFIRRCGSPAQAVTTMQYLTAAS